MKLTNKSAKSMINNERKYISLIECGKCNSCKLNKAREWGIRASLEMKNSEPNTNWFVTLTYKDENQHKNKNGIFELNYNDLRRFLNTVRKSQERKNEKIKYIASGEYGGAHKKPHFHLIIFNLKIEQNNLKVIGKNNLKQQLYQNKQLNNQWKKGFVTIGKASYESANYTTRYTIKSQNNEKWCKKHGLEHEKTIYSQGIGLQYLEKNKIKILENDKITFKTQKGIITTLPPKYYTYRLKKEKNEKILENIKKRQELGEENFEKMIEANGLKLTEIYAKEQKILNQKIKYLNSKK